MTTTTTTNTYAGIWVWLVAVSITGGVAAGILVGDVGDGFNWGAFLLGAVIVATLNAPVVMAFWNFGVHIVSMSDNLKAIREGIAAVRENTEAPQSKRAASKD
jgi:hypothetical protein